MAAVIEKQSKRWTYQDYLQIEDEQRYAPPEMGEQTEELLREAGYSDDEIAQFKTGGVI